MFTPSIDIQDGSVIRAFLTRCGLKDYESLVERADAEPDWFWSQILDLANVRFSPGYPALAVAARLNDCAAKAVLTADASRRRGRPVPHGIRAG